MREISVLNLLIRVPGVEADDVAARSLRIKSKSCSNGVQALVAETTSLRLYVNHFFADSFRNLAAHGQCSTQLLLSYMRNTEKLDEIYFPDATLKQQVELLAPSRHVKHHDEKKDVVHPQDRRKSAATLFFLFWDKMPCSCHPFSPFPHPSVLFHFQPLPYPLLCRLHLVSGVRETDCNLRKFELLAADAKGLQEQQIIASLRVFECDEVLFLHQWIRHSRRPDVCLVYLFSS